jgi:hypothetical protein
MPKMLLYYVNLFLKNSEHVNIYLKLYFNSKFLLYMSFYFFITHLTRLSPMQLNTYTVFPNLFSYCMEGKIM